MMALQHTVAFGRVGLRYRLKRNFLAAVDRPGSNEVIAMTRICAGIASGTLVAAIALPMPVFIAAGALAQEIKLTRSATSGVQSLLVDERSWDANCKPLATSVTITSKPSN